MRRLMVACVVLALSLGGCTPAAEEEDEAGMLGPGATLAAEQGSSAAGPFGPAGSLAEARAFHTATPLSDGRVLVVGGRSDVHDDPFDVAEVWDPATASFSPAGSLAEARAFHTTTLLPDGRAIVVGGSGGDGRLASAEVWDPATATFGPAGSLAEARMHHTTTLLPDGRAIVVGGSGEDGPFDRLASAEVWEPATASFAPTGSLAEAREHHTATLLPSGRVLVVGGWPLLRGEASAEAWDPATASFGPAGSLAEARRYHTATLLPDGRALVVGGEGLGDSFASAEVWVPGVAVISDADRYFTMMIAVEPFDSRPMGDLALNLSMSPDSWERWRIEQGRAAFDDMLARLDAVDVRECFREAHWLLRSSTQAADVGLDMILDHQGEAGKSVFVGGLALAQQGQ